MNNELAMHKRNRANIREELNLGKKNYPVNMNAPERTVQLSFQRKGSNKNVINLVLFNLMLQIMQKDELWIK